MEKSEVEKIISLARDKYTVHDCGECTYRKCCDLNSNGFGSAECLARRVSISLMLGIEDGYFTKLLDDIEETWRREKAELEANALAVGGIVEAERHTPGNAAAMREALLIVKRLFDGRLMFLPVICEAHKAVDAALSAPPRQCDVGTPEELEERFKHFCASNYSACDVDMGCCRCPLESEKASCVFAWAQTPYTEEEREGDSDGRK